MEFLYTITLRWTVPAAKKDKLSDRRYRKMLKDNYEAVKNNIEQACYKLLYLWYYINVGNIIQYKRGKYG